MRYEQGDYVKIEFASDDGVLPAEWMWVRVRRCDEDRRLAFGQLDNEPITEMAGIHLGQELAISFDKVREHKKPWEFKKN